MRAKKLPAGELERQVLDLLWEANEPLTPGVAHEKLSQSHEVAYTTVMTILVRLWEKEVLLREKQGRAYAYRPVQSREERAASRMTALLAGAGDPRIALSRFVEDLGPDQREDLRRALKGQRRSQWSTYNHHRLLGIVGYCPS